MNSSGMHIINYSSRLLGGRVSAQGGCLIGGVSARGGCLPRGSLPDTLPVNRMTDVCENITLP